MLIGLTGRARSGKTTAASALQDFYSISFADALKEAAKILFSLTDAQLHYKKDEIDPNWKLTPREILQKLGTFCRDTNDNVFILIMKRKIEEAKAIGVKDIIIPDVRFNNEAKFVIDMGGKVISIERDAAKTPIVHTSEKGISKSYIAFTLENNKSVEQLQEAIRKYAKTRFLSI